jgi:collagenase-like PrtC family protease
MSGLEFSVPYNNDPETLDEIVRLKERNGNRIREVYLSGPQEYAGAGRIAPEMGYDDLATVVGRIRAAGLGANLLLNSVCEGDDWYSPAVLGSTMEYVRRAHEELGVAAVTISNPLYIREVRRRFPKLEICASVLGEIDCVSKAVVFRRAGADVITPSVDINRDLGLLARIREATGAEIKLMVNEGCLAHCAFRKFHFNYIAHKSRRPYAGKTRPEDNVFSLNCLALCRADRSQILKSGWVRPEDAGRYAGVASCFKLVGRTSSRSMVVRAIEAYMDESWEGDLLELMAGSLYSAGMSGLLHLDNRSLGEMGFFDRVTSCDHQCDRCTWCAEVALRLLRSGVFTPEKLGDLGLR